MIDVTGLVFAYPGGKEPAVNDLEFAVEDGEIFGFLGPNGAGKSTTQKVLTGLLRDYSGKVHVLEREVREWGSDLYEQIGVGFELPVHYGRLTARESGLDLVSRVAGGSSPRLARRPPSRARLRDLSPEQGAGGDCDEARSGLGGGLPVLLYFVSTPWQWIGSVPLPLYYPIRLFWTAADGRAEWWLILPGLILQGGALVWLLRRFQRTVYA